MQVKSFWVPNVRALHDMIAGLDFQPALAFVFPDVKHDISEIHQVLSNVKLFGATSSGEIFNNKSFASGISGLLLDPPQDSFEVIFVNQGDKTPFEVGQALALRAKEFFDEPSLVISAPGFSDGDELQRGIFSVLPPETRVIGGFSGDDLTFVNAKIFDNRNIASYDTNSMIAVVFDSSKVRIDGFAVHGWKIISDVHTITHSEGNVVYEIDGRPALDVFREVLNIPEDQVYDLVKNLGPRYPVLLYRYNRPPVLRHPIIVDVQQKSITFSANMPVLSTIEFGQEPHPTIIERTIKYMRNNLKNRMEDADAVVLFSCKARQLAFGPDIDKEVEGIYNLWNKPMAGFFTYGEIGIANDGKTDFHNETCNVLLIKELE